jgi:hypothetical protein
MFLTVVAFHVSAAVTAEECALIAIGAENWEVLGACYPGRIEDPCPSVPLVCRLCRASIALCAARINQYKRELGLSDYLNDFLMAALSACDGYDLGTALPTCVLESLQATE